MKILIIDDEKIVRDHFMQVAQSHAHNDIDTASSGEEALTQVIRKNYDLITLDIEMPGVGGLEIIAMLRNMCPHAVISVISGHLPDELSSEVAGCIDVLIEKPVSVMTFSQLLETSAQICDAMDKIRLLGTAPTVVR